MHSSLSVLALALVQLEFLSDTGRTDDASKLAGGTEASLETSADLLGLSIEELTGALLTRPLQVAREKFVKPNKVGEAQSARDALAKDVYLGIFNYLLKKINEATRYATNHPCLMCISRYYTVYCCAFMYDSRFYVMYPWGGVRGDANEYLGQGE